MSCVVFCKPSYQMNAFCENLHCGFWIPLHVVISVVYFKCDSIIDFGVQCMERKRASNPKSAECDSLNNRQQFT